MKKAIQKTNTSSHTCFVQRRTDCPQTEIFKHTVEQDFHRLASICMIKSSAYEQSQQTAAENDTVK